MSVSAYSLRARHHRSRNDGSERYNNFIRTPREHQGGVPRNDKELRYEKLPISDFTTAVVSETNGHDATGEDSR